MSLSATENLFRFISVKNDLEIKKDFLTVCQILRNFTEGNARKFSDSFAFCAHVDATKYRITLTFFWRAPRLLELSSLARVRS